MRTLPLSHPARQRGISMVEVLVTLIVLALGLLGLAGLQARLQVSDAEAYQRAQALLLLNDMASRIATNRAQAPAYAAAAANPLGTGMSCPPAGSTLLSVDVAEWCAALQGAGERAGGANVGAMIGGRGCIQHIGGGEYLITVAWQGLAPLSAPPAAVSCGQGAYDGAAAGCIGDRCRRAVTTVVRIAALG